MQNTFSCWYSCCRRQKVWSNDLAILLCLPWQIDKLSQHTACLTWFYHTILLDFHILYFTKWQGLFSPRKYRSKAWMVVCIFNIMCITWLNATIKKITYIPTYVWQEVYITGESELHSYILHCLCRPGLLG